MAKAYEFLAVKNCNVEIPKYFLTQLCLYEARLINAGNRLKSIDDNYGKYEEEQIMINTYLNIKQLTYNKIPQSKTKQTSNKKIRFCEKSNINKKNVKYNENILRPIKSILKSIKLQTPLLSISSNTNDNCNNDIYAEDTLYKNNIINENLLSTIGPERGLSPILSFKINSGNIDKNINSNTSTELRPSPYSSTNSSLSESVNDDFTSENGNNTR